MTVYPRVVVTDETLREGMQIESASIPVEAKLELLRAIEDAGVRRIVVGSFVSPKWTPQMAEVDTLMRQIQPREDVTYLALALNERGRERMRQFSPPLTIEEIPQTHLHLCDVFIKRNTNRTLEQQEATWRQPIEQARAAGVTEATIGLSAAWGSNWRGEFPQQLRLLQLQRQWDAWQEAGVAVTGVLLADPMGWNMPDRVTADLRAIKERFPTIKTFALHLHNQRGLALVSTYAAIMALDPSDTLKVDATLGGIGGCPYCGNGRAAGMAPSEDLFQLLETLGIPTGVDLYRLADAVALATRIVGRPLDGHVSKAGPFPFGSHLYPPSVPMVETHAQAEHFRLGPSVYEGNPRPWEGDGTPAKDGAAPLAATR